MNIYSYAQFLEARKQGKTTDNDGTMLRTYLSERIVQYAQQLARENKKYRYLITFTLKEDGMNEEEVQAYIEKQMLREPLKIEEFHISKEYTKSGRAHFHCAVQTAKPLKKDRFHYYQKKYGFVDISRTKAQTLDEALNYINKDSESKQVL